MLAQVQEMLAVELFSPAIKQILWLNNVNHSKICWIIFYLITL